MTTGGVQLRKGKSGCVCAGRRGGKHWVLMGNRRGEGCRGEGMHQTSEVPVSGGRERE